MAKPKIRNPDLVFPRKAVTDFRGLLTRLETTMLVERPVLNTDQDKVRQATMHYRIAQMREQLDRLFDDPTPPPDEQVAIMLGVMDGVTDLMAKVR